MSFLLNALDAIQRPKQLPVNLFAVGPRAAQEPGTPDMWDRTFDQINDKASPIPPGAAFLNRTPLQADYPAEAFKSSAAVGKAVPSFDGAPKEAVSGLPEPGKSPLLAEVARAVSQPVAATIPDDNGRAAFQDGKAANDAYWLAQGKAETGLDGIMGRERIQQLEFGPNSGFQGLSSARDRYLASKQSQGQQVGFLTQALNDVTKRDQFDTIQGNQMAMNAADNASREKIAGMHYTPEAIKSRTRDSVLGAMVAQDKPIGQIASTLRKVDVLNSPGGAASLAPSQTGQSPPSHGVDQIQEDDRVGYLLNAIRQQAGDGKSPAVWNREKAESLLDALGDVGNLSPAAQKSLMEQARPLVGNSTDLGDAIVRAVSKGMVNDNDRTTDTKITLTNEGDNRIQRTWDTIRRFQSSPAYSRAIYGSRTVPLDGSDTTNRTPWLTSQATLDKEKAMYSRRMATGSQLLSMLKELGYQ